jgi:pseudouridine kinase
MPPSKPPVATPAAPYIALVGGANLDIAARPHATALLGDSNPGSILCSPGGVARNVAENLLRLGLQARLLSVLGDDAFAAVLRQSGAAIGLDLQACITLPGQRTATYLSLHGMDGDMGVAVNDMGILEQLTPALLGPHSALLAGAAVLVVDCNVRPDVLLWLCQAGYAGGDAPGTATARAARHGASPALFAEAVSVAKCHKLLPVLGSLHTLKANRLEAQALSGLAVSDPLAAQAAAHALHQRGVGQVVISLGAQGVAWCDAQGHSGHRAARSITMASATGAGDALLSGLVYGHVQALPLDLSVQFAMACAELTLSSTFANSPELCVAAVRAHLNQETA